jgi:hypothetical protein
MALQNMLHRARSRFGGSDMKEKRSCQSRQPRVLVEDRPATRLWRPRMISAVLNHGAFGGGVYGVKAPNWQVSPDPITLIEEAFEQISS